MIDNTVLGAIIGAISAGALDGTKDVAKKALSDGYDKLKNSLINRFGGKSSVANALTQVEAKPSSEGRLKVLEEELTESGAASDHELSIYARELGEIIKNLQGITGSQVFNNYLVSLTFDGGDYWTANGFLHLDALLGVPFAIEHGRVRIVDEHPFREI
jgi:hypothetical protein